METHENIKYLREKIGLSQEALAERVGYKDRSSIAKIEAGLVDLSQSKISAFASALGVTPAQLMCIPADDTNDSIDPVTQELFDLVDGMSSEDLLMVIDMIKAIKKRRGETGE